MPFNSYPYFVFLAAAVLGFRLLERHGPTGRRVFLLVMSYGFYAWWRADFLLLLLGSTLVNFLLGRAIEARRLQGYSSRPFLVAGLLFNLGLIGVFKYDTLLVSSTNNLLGLGWPVPHLFLPLAISFFTFEQISYLVDADAGKTHGYSPLDYALFVAYFPHLIAGPIVRHNDLIPQFRQLRARDDELSTGVTLFTIGLAKKSLIADNLAPFADAVFDAAGRGTPAKSCTTVHVRRQVSALWAAETTSSTARNAASCASSTPPTSWAAFNAPAPSASGCEIPASRDCAPAPRPAGRTHRAACPPGSA